MPKSDVLVTGGAGCIGSELVEAVLAQGHSVTVLDNLSSGKIEHLAAALRNPNCSFVEGDLLDPETVSAAVRGVDIVYHLAANPDVKFVPGEPTDKDLRQNIIATYNVLESMRAWGVRKLVFSSTSAVYGVREELPIPESAPTLRPISLYGATKLSCEAMIGAFQHLFEMQCWIFRFANVVGARIRKRGRTVISDFVARLQQDPSRLLILGNGKQAKSYLLCQECIEGILYGVAHARDAWNVFNLGGHDSLSVDEIARMVVGRMGLKDVEFAYTGTEGGWPGDVPRFLLDVSSINALGWRARSDSRTAVSIAIDAILAADRQPVGERCRP